MDTATPKYIQAAELIRSRVGHGEYLNLPLPGAPKLAKECGISYLTARQALARLVESGEFVRKDNGRIYRAGCELETPNLKIANIMPQHIGINYRWRNAIAASARDHGCSFSDVIYVNCDEPVIFETLDQDFDVIFFQIPEISEILFQKLLTMSGKLVSLFDDMTGYGIRCFDGMSQEAITVMMEHLHRRGFDKIDFFAVEMKRVGADRRREIWSRGLKEFGCSGNSYVNVCEYGVPSIFSAYQSAKKLLSEQKFIPGQAIYCNNVECAQGVIRALSDAGIHVPRDVSVVSFGNPERAMLNTPSITIVNTPDPQPTVDRLLDSYLGKSGPPQSLMYNISLQDVSREQILWHGESVGFGPAYREQNIEQGIVDVK